MDDRCSGGNISRAITEMLDCVLWAARGAGARGEDLGFLIKI